MLRTTVHPGAFHLILSAMIFTIITHAQTTIRERVTISPRPTTTQTKAASTTTSPDLFRLIDTTKAFTNFPGIRITVSSVTMPVPTPPPAGIAGLYIELETDFAGSYALKRLWVCDGVVHETNFALPTIDLTTCQQVYMLYKLIGNSGFGRCDPRDGLFKFARATVSGSGATFQINDVVPQSFSAPVPVSATVTIAGASLPGFALTSVKMTPAKTTLTCVDTTKVSFNALTGNGQPMTLCGGTTLSTSASIQARGPYAYLRFGSQEGPTLNFNMTTASSSFVVVLDTTKGVVPQGFDVATVRVTVEGVTKDTTINLSCPYPLPSVSILRPRDTTIVLTATNQPTVTFQETHSPTSGKFEPGISWNPSQTINTGDYFDQIQDSLVLLIKVRAQNVAGDTAVDSTRMTLKKNVLDSLIVTAEPDSIEPTQASVIKVIAKDNNNNDLTLPGTAPIQFSLDAEGASLGRLETPSSNGSSVTATWAEVQSGSVKYVALDAPASPPAAKASSASNGVTAKMAQTDEIRGRAVITATVTHQGVTKSGSATVVVKDPIVLKITVEKSKVRPAGTGGNSTTAVTVTATRGEVPVPNVLIKLKAEGVEGTGGHDHIGNRPAGEFSNGIAQVDSVTDANGKVTITYTASEFGGEEKITASSSEAKKPAEVKVTVRVPGLEPLQASLFYELVGAPQNHAGTNDPCRSAPPTSQHSRNHYGTGELIHAIQNIAAAYTELHPGVRLRINDMSLENGGLFDNLNNWQYVRGQSHGEHRAGKNADIGFSGINNDNRCIERLQLVRLRKLIDRYTTDVPYEHTGQSAHFHIRMR